MYRVDSKIDLILMMVFLRLWLLLVLAFFYSTLWSDSFSHHPIQYCINTSTCPNYCL